MSRQRRWPRGTPGGGHRPGPGPGRFRPERGPGGRSGDWVQRLSDRLEQRSLDPDDWWDNNQGPQYQWARQVLDALRAREIEPEDYGDRLYDLPFHHEQASETDLADPEQYAAGLAEQLELDDAMDRAFVETLGNQLQERSKQWSQNSFGTWLKGRGAIHPPGQVNGITGEALGDPDGWKLTDSFWVGDATLGVYPTLEAAQEAYERWEQHLQRRQGREDMRASIARFRFMESARGEDD